MPRLSLLRQRQRRRVTRAGASLGLDELMIVNPGPSASGVLVFGEPGMLYPVAGPSRERARRWPELLIGADGRRYRLTGLGRGVRPALVRIALAEGTAAEAPGTGRLFLGEEGTVYGWFR